MVVRFGAFTLDMSARTLQRGAHAIRLSPKAFDLLVVLVRRRPAAIAKADIHECLWPDTFVSDGNLAVLIAELRTALGDSAREPRFIRTVQRFGYAFAGLVEEDSPDREAAQPPRAPCWLVWANRRAALVDGENVLGRDPAADVCIDAVGVSRRHALIVVAGDEVTLADLSSKNGTFARGERVLEPIVLAEDTEIRLGPVSVRFCRPAAGASTLTWDASRTGSLT